MKQATTGVVIAHYHPKGKVAAHLHQLVAYLAQHVTTHVVLVSTGIAPAEVEVLRPHCQVISRDNFGYDFWSYKVGLEALPAGVNWQRLLLLNSSFIAVHPELLIGQLLAPAPSSRILGLTSSRMFDSHLQSYCLLFDGADLIQSQAMRQWWSQMEPISDRDQVIHRYEIGLSRYFHSHGVPLAAALVPSQHDRFMAIIRTIAQQGAAGMTIPAQADQVSLRLEFSEQTNPTHSMWDRLFAQFGVVKIDFLRKSVFASQLLTAAQHTPRWTNTSAYALIVDALE